MENMWKVGRHYLMGHGVLMLCLGMALFSLGSAMSNPLFDKFGYTMAVTLTLSCLLTLTVYFLMVAIRVRLRNSAAVYFLATAFTTACWVIFWLTQSAPLDVNLLSLIAGLHGTFWSLWYVRLAIHFQTYETKAALLCVLAATAAFLGIILATQSQISHLSAVTAVACYFTFTGVQILFMAVYLHRECETEEICLPSMSEKTDKLRVTRTPTCQ